ncbi:MAG: FAD-dependent thymidylate synthase [Candidatus Paracaedibacteraceae bacterium]|nr:FAD-dependent thymidylate synthase [Candidatus Paracaedibacteraceae bacterium]
MKQDFVNPQLVELNELRDQSYQTRRATVPALEAMLYEPQSVLDHGFVRVVDYMGDDNAIVQAARVSYGKGTKKVSEDRGLIRYLMRHWHSTPFEMCEIKLHVKLPMFVARQWIRHRTANVNEYSARYSILDREFYVPAPEHLSAQSLSNRQGRAGVLEGEHAEKVLNLLKEDSMRCYDNYMWLLNEDESQGEHQGLARELARMNLPVNFYTQWYWKVDLHNLMHFLRLRADPHAQYEIRAYADVILNIMKAWVPLAFEAFEEYRLGAAQLSATGVRLLQRRLAGEKITLETSGLSKREWVELCDLFDLT